MRHFLLFLCIATAFAESNFNGRRSVVMDGKTAQLVIDIAGGSIVDFHLKSQNLNVFNWQMEGGKTDPRPMGHFICLDRWGQPSDAELKNGMPFHGEATRVVWKVAQDSQRDGSALVTDMSAALPMAGIETRRKVRLLDDGAVFHVTESATNNNKLGRVYNFVQHPTIGPPFLMEDTVVDSNGRQGFMQSSPMPNPEHPTVTWPQALKDGMPVNLRHLHNDPLPNVVSFVIDDEYGWTTAATPSKGLLLGYVWKTSDYPWFNVWRHVENGKPFARGLEFGTTGLHQPFPILTKKNRIFGRLLYAYLDAGQTETRSYTAFLAPIPADYKGVERVTWKDGRVTLHERGGTPARNITVDLGQR